MGDSYYPQTYKNYKGGIEKHYVWASNLKKAKFKSAVTGQTLTFKDVYDEPVVQSIAIKTPTKSRGHRAERKKRSTEHFKKEIYPSFGANSTERKHFSKKLGLKA